MSVEIKTGNAVLPGDRLGVIEEFVPGNGTYQEDGVIYAAAAGTILIDAKEKKVAVSPFTEPVLPKKGDIILGSIEAVEGKRAYVTIAMIGEKALAYPFSGMIFIRQATGRFLDSIFEAFAPGDVIRAIVVDDEDNTYRLSTADEGLGVIHTFCSKCGAEVAMEKRRLRCLSCGSFEQRKVAVDYRMVINSKEKESRVKEESVSKKGKKI